ncbi:MAG: CDP-alcohol phosphatidyltransferase family protein [Planctomycetota bacterium]
MLSKQQIPNALTMLRLVLAAVFFLLLALYRVDQGVAWLMIPAIVLFIAAAVTDALDGHLARKWQVESKFGRIMDPFCDKVLILGALIFLAGPSFTFAYIWNPSGTPELLDATVRHAQISGVYPWMVVLILARELLVTGIRGVVEATGQKFGANLWGKLKMILQAIVVPLVLLIVLIYDGEHSFGYDLSNSVQMALRWVRDALVYLTVIASVLSGVPYVAGALRVFGKPAVSVPEEDGG